MAEQQVCEHITTQKSWQKLLVEFRSYCRDFKDDYDSQALREHFLTSRIQSLTKDLAAIRGSDPSFERLFANFTKNDQPLDQDECTRIIKAKLDGVAGAASYTDLNDKGRRAMLFTRFLLSLSLPQLSSRQLSISVLAPAEIEEHFSRQFDREFRGNAPVRFLKFVLQVRIHFDGSPGRDLYFNGSPVVQSSGTGKTRMVLELGKYAPLLFVCLRPDSSTAAHGFPPSDEKVVSYFSSSAAALAHVQPEQGPLKAKYSCDLQVAAFLGAWFEHLAARLKGCASVATKCTELSEMNRYAGSGQASVIITGTKNRRDTFFDRVCKLAQQKLDQASAEEDTSDNHEDTFAACLDQGIQALGQQLREVRDHLWELESNEKVRSLLQEIVNAEGAPNQQVDGRPPIFVAVDECVHLIQNMTNQDHQLNSLRRAWNFINGREKKLGSPSFWLVLLSTNSAATILIEPKESLGSDRARLQQVAPTFVALGFDVIRPEASPLASAGEVADLRHLRSYGRPLWVSLRNQRFWGDAQMKLLGTRAHYGDVLAGQVPSLHYNILASRLALRFVPMREGSDSNRQTELATGSVDRHMRILERVVEDSRLSITAPSEPVLAIAAALIMLPVYETVKDVEKHAKDRYEGIISGFCGSWLSLLKSTQHRGVWGELMARMVLMAAWDAAKLPILLSESRHEKDAGCLERIARFFHHPMPLLDLLKQLANLDMDSLEVLERRIESVCTLVESSLYTSDAPSMSSAPSSKGKDAVKGESQPKSDPSGIQAWINFTHFDILPRSLGEITCDLLWDCWQRGVALQADHHQTGVDGFIPVFVGDLQRTYDVKSGQGSSAEGAGSDSLFARHMTYVAWEAKNQTAIVDGNSINLFGPPLKAARAGAHSNDEVISNKPLTRRGLLTLFMEFGTRTSLRDGRYSKASLMEPEQAPRGKKRKAGSTVIEAVQRSSRRQKEHAGADTSSSRSPQWCPVDQEPFPAVDCGDGQGIEGSGQGPMFDGFAVDEYVRVKLRGTMNGDIYPCLDKFAVRGRFYSLVGNLPNKPVPPSYERDNCVESPIWTQVCRSESAGFLKEV